MGGVFFGAAEYCEIEYGNFIVDEYTHTLRLESELSDLRVGYANPYPENFGFSGWAIATDHVREFALPFRASDTEAAEQCFEPKHRRAMR